MTERGKGVRAGSNKIKLGKGNEGLMKDFSTAKSIQVGKHSSRRLKTLGHQPVPQEKECGEQPSSGRGAAAGCHGLPAQQQPAHP